MRVRRFADPAAFAARAEPYLVADEALHILPLGVIAGIVRQPGHGGAAPYLATVETAGAVVTVALITPPRNLILARVAAPGALDALIADLLDTDIRPPGVQGPVPCSRGFAARWCARTGQTARRAMAQRIYRLDHVIPPVGVPGELRPLAAAERDLAVAWAGAFIAEAEDNPDPRAATNMVAQRLDSPLGGLALWWHDGRPVTLVGYAGPTPNGIRIGPVYTPPADRRRGYATAATAALSQHLLDNGRRWVALFTDLANPTSNHIYQAIGYRAVGDVDDYRFAP